MSYLGQFKDALHDLMTLTTGIPETHVYYMYENVPEPEGLSIAMVVSDFDPINGGSQATYTDDDETLPIVTEFISKVNIYFKGAGAESASADFVLNLGHVNHWSEFDAKDISILQINKPKFQPEKREGQWTSRYAVEMSFAFAAGSKETIDVIETVQIGTCCGDTLIINEQ